MGTPPVDPGTRGLMPVNTSHETVLSQIRDRPRPGGYIVGGDPCAVLLGVLGISWHSKSYGWKRISRPVKSPESPAPVSATHQGV